MPLSITLLGTGCPVAHPDRHGAAQLIEADGAKILVDCGSGVAQQIVAAGTRGADIDALLLTHYHSDHMVDFYQLIVSSWHQGRARPWKVYATPPALAHIEKQMTAWRDERELRISFEQRPNGTAGFELELHELKRGTLEGDFGSLRIDTIEVDHAPIVPAYGFRFSDGEASMVLSGDTRPCQAIEDAAIGADLLVHEVYIHDQMPAGQGSRTPETIKRVSSYHTVPEDLGPLAARAGVRALALTHFVPVVFDRQQLIDQIGRNYSGPIIVGEDLMRIDVVTRRVTWGRVAVRI